MQAKLLCDLDSDPPEAYPFGIAPKGTIINNPQAFMLVRMGVAEPADEECEKVAGMTPEQMKAAQYAAARTARGIAPEDFVSYDAGEMIGYYADGTPIPGPNFVSEEEEGDEDDGSVFVSM